MRKDSSHTKTPNGNTGGIEQIEAAVKNTQDTASKMFKAGKDTAQKFVSASADAFTKSYDKATAMTREQVEKSWPQAVSKFDEAAAIGRDNLQAAFDAQAIAAKGFEAIADEFAALGQRFADAHVANMRALFGIRSVQELVEVQSGIARSTFDSAFAGASKVAELSAKVASDVAEPIQARVTKVVEKYGKAPAAY